jgi:hypothetical protein
VEFQEASQQLMQLIQTGVYIGLISDVTFEELENAPAQVREVLKRFDSTQLVRLPQTEEVLNLGEDYLQARAVSRRFEDDALHVAYATVHRADLMVSWNFKHLVNFQRIRAFNAVNLQQGYGLIDIRTPKELLYGKEEEGL